MIITLFDLGLHFKWKAIQKKLSIYRLKVLDAGLRGIEETVNFVIVYPLPSVLNNKILSNSVARPVTPSACLLYKAECRLASPLCGIGYDQQISLSVLLMIPENNFPFTVII